MANSCCRLIDLQKACVVTGTLKVALAGAFVLYDSVILAVEAPKALEEQKLFLENPALDPYRFHSIRAVMTGMNAMFWLACVYLGIILVIAAKKRNVRGLRRWYVLTCILTVVFVVDIFMEAFSMIAPVVAIISPSVGAALLCYMLWIVSDFMEEVGRGVLTFAVKKPAMEVIEEHEDEY